jgi:arginase
MAQFTIVEAPSILGLFPKGVELAPEALRAAGLVEGLGATEGGHVEPPPYDPTRDPATGMLNPAGIAAYSPQLADAIGAVLDAGDFPVVLGGDCSILIGAALALKRRGRFGLFFLDGHTDFWEPERSKTGEAAELELGIVTGRGPAPVSDLDGLSPYVHDEDIVLFGPRDDAERAEAGVRDARNTRMRVFPFDRVRSLGATTAAAIALQPGLGLRPQGPLAESVEGFWIHLDADVLDDGAMPAVDYRQSGGLSPAELREVLKLPIRTGRAVGITITIYNPRLDPDGTAGRVLAAAVVAGLQRTAA